MRLRAHRAGFPLRPGASPLPFGSRQAPWGTSVVLHSCSPALSAMPGGVPWFAYLKMVSSSLLAMCAGAQVVHWYYRPDLTIPEIPPKPGELKTELLGLKERHHKPQVSQQ
ncbi:hypothetical protein HispidOSU_005607 [Sigmodon hispidus]